MAENSKPSQQIITAVVEAAQQAGFSYVTDVETVKEGMTATLVTPNMVLTGTITRNTSETKTYKYIRFFLEDAFLYAYEYKRGPQGEWSTEPNFMTLLTEDVKLYAFYG